MVSRVPVIVVLGATGTGKSKLAIQIAQRFKGEIISADSMQVYKGLDVITNKVTTEEAEGVPHHLLDFLNPTAKFSVVDFRNKALPLIDDLLEKNKTPVIVGGTNYYIESLLWKVLVEEPDVSESLLEEKDDGNEEEILNGIELSDRQKVVIAYSDILRVLKYVQGVVKKTIERLIIAISSETEMEEPENCFWPLNELAALQNCVSKYMNDFKIPQENAMDLDIGAPEDLLDDLSRLIRSLSDLKNTNYFTLLASGVEELCRRAKAEEIESSIDREGVKSFQKEMEERLRDLTDLQSLKGVPTLQTLRSQQLHDRLSLLDPEMADSLHPNDRRKILRSLQVLAQKGRMHSDILKEQRSQEGGSHLGGPLRYENTAIFWLTCQMDILDKRLDDRVDDMLSRGLVQELLDFHEVYNRERLETADKNEPYTQGIFQSIGFKEFHNYLLLSSEERETDKGRQLLEKGVEELKMVTRRYARHQNKWVRNRFLKVGSRQVPPVYGLDTSDVSKWNESALEPALQVVSSLVDPKKRSEKHPTPLPRDTSTVSETRVSHFCEVCQRVFVGDHQWQAHLSSKKHQRVAKSKENSKSGANISSTN